jgi:NAD(P)-dependent dehydrogenase (short-subunit alcohol dehydrogenase family)
MKGKTVLFTGASRGMGRYAAIEFARRGARLLVVGHNEARGLSAVEAIRGAGGSAEFIRADMGDGVGQCAHVHSAAPFLPANLSSRLKTNGSAPEPGAAGIAAAKSEGR